LADTLPDAPHHTDGTQIVCRNHVETDLLVVLDIKRTFKLGPDPRMGAVIGD
jgi:hypothetical protein